MRMDYRGDPSGGPLQAVLNTAYGGFAAAGRSFEPLLRAAARGNLEAFSLLSRRTQAYMELPLRLSQCRTPQDIADEQMRFWQTMSQQYAESSQQVLKAWSEIVAQGSLGRGAENKRDYITFPDAEGASERHGRSSQRRVA